MPFLKKSDFQKWASGSHDKSYERLGAHPNKRGTWFSVWAPHASSVSVIGDFNDWDSETNPLTRVGEGHAGFWEAYVRTAKPGHHYKFRISNNGYVVDKTDPYAFAMEAPVAGGNPIAGMSAIVSDINYEWSDGKWMAERSGPATMDTPMAIYELHLGSWRRNEDGTSPGYRDIAAPLADYVLEQGFTHIELMPVMEHPYYASWGYQVVGYFAASHRYGSPQDLQYLINYLHSKNIGVLLDWVPAHFATDAQGLVFFDGTTLYEYTDPLMRNHPDWGTYVFDYEKPGVQSFLISNALFWLDKYHIDGLRVDAVASMLYRDYSRDDWRPNRFGGRENLEAVDLLKRVNESVYSHFSNVHMIAEESTAWPGVTSPTYDNGLGFLHKWNMGWMHDTLRYMSQNPVNRKHHNNDLTFPLWYAFSEKYILPLSHDEVVHGKGSLWNKMPGDPWQKAANLKLLFAHQYGHPGKKLLFMGGEFGQTREWNCDASLEWHLTDDPLHGGVQKWVSRLNHLYQSREALWSDSGESFKWVVFEDTGESVASYIRSGSNEDLLFIFNFTPVPRPAFPMSVPTGEWKLELSSDDNDFGGSGTSVHELIDVKPDTEEILSDGEANSKTEMSALDIRTRTGIGVFALPPLGALIYSRMKTRQTGPAKKQN